MPRMIYPPDNPSPEMLDRGAKVMERSSDNDDPLVRAHDVWQAMYDEWLSQVAIAAPEGKK